MFRAKSISKGRHQLMKRNDARWIKMNDNGIKAATWLFTVCLLMTFLPSSLMQALGVESFIKRYSVLIGLIEILTFTYLAISACFYGLNIMQQKRRHTYIQEQILTKLNILDLNERAILREFFIRRSSVLVMPDDDVSVQALYEAGIIKKIFTKMNHPQNRQQGDPSSEYKISPEARKVMTRSQLAMPTQNMTHDDINRFKRIRPNCVQAIYKPSKIIRAKFRRRYNEVSKIPS